MNRHNMDQDELDDLRWEYRFEREDPLFTVAVHICEGCGQTADRLTAEPLEQLMFCDECMEETLIVLAREAKADPQQARMFPVKEVA
jgi:hypothetical protein